MKRFPGKIKENNEPAIDIILKILTAANAARPNAAFITSLLQQYRERGGLSKKQLEGLYSKASKIEEIPIAHLATLQAIILKKTTRHKTELSEPQASIEEDMDMPMISAILEKYPTHKQVAIFHNKKQTRQPLSTNEKEALKRLYKLLIKS